MQAGHRLLATELKCALQRAHTRMVRVESYLEPIIHSVLDSAIVGILATTGMAWVTLIARRPRKPSLQAANHDTLLPALGDVPLRHRQPDAALGLPKRRILERML